MEIKLKELYTVAEVAQILMVSEKSVRDFIKVGELKGVKVGQWRISSQSIQDFLEARSNHYKAKARTEVQGFLDCTETLQKGEERTLVIKDYHTMNPDLHGPIGSWLMQQLPQGSNLRWRFFYEPEFARARHIFTGNLQLIVKLLQDLEQKLEGDK